MPFAKPLSKTNELSAHRIYPKTARHFSVRCFRPHRICPKSAAHRLFAVRITDLRPPLLRDEQDQRTERPGDDPCWRGQKMDDQRVPDEMRHMLLQLRFQRREFLRRKPFERLRQGRLEQARPRQCSGCRQRRAPRRRRRAAKGRSDEARSETSANPGAVA